MAPLLTRERAGARWVIGGALLTGAGLVLSRVSPSARASTIPHQREVALTYVARVPRLPAEAGEVQLWIPLAKTRAEQQVKRRDVRAPVPYAITRDPEYGNDILHLQLKAPVPQPLEVSVDYDVVLMAGGAAAHEPPPTAAELRRSLHADQLVSVDGNMRAIAKRATAGRRTLKARARGVYEYVIRHMTYDKTTPGWGRGDARRACLLGKGNCTDFHSLFMSLARAERIPARFKIGTLMPEGASGTIPGYHCWAEFYVAGEGWVPVDASEAWKHPELMAHYFGARDGDRWLLSVGRDIQLVPRQRGGPVNIFFYPYMEVDGTAFAGVETEVRFQDLQRGG